MKKKNRVKKNEEFQLIIRKRNSYANKSFVIYTANKKEIEARVGISVSKKLGNAVKRNKIKRQLRMMIDELYDYKSEKKDLLVIVRANYNKQKYLNNKKDLEIALKNAKINKKLNKK